MIFQDEEFKFNAEPLTTDFLESVKRSTCKYLDMLIATVEENFPDAYPGNIFKNTERQVELLAKLKS